ncbi:MAG: hypothetical protein LEGION0398_MBIBDBAK_00878 [Legionellaceae bacterium]
MHNLLLIFLAFSLNGLFVAAEFAMVKLRQTKVHILRETSRLKGQILSKIHVNLDAYLSACQLGITLTSLGLGWIGEPTFANLIQPILYKIGIVSSSVIKAAAFAIAFFLISFLHIVLGELVPKSIAIRRPETTSLWTAPFLYGFYQFMFPLIWILNSCANFTLKLLGIRQNLHETENNYTAAELKLIFDASHAQGQLHKEEMEILEHALDLASLNAADLMRPVDEMVLLNVNDSIDKNIDKIITHHYSRYPIYQSEPNQLIGILHVKDLFATLHQKKSLTNLKTQLRPLLKVPRDMPATELFQQFRLGFSHFAAVYNDSDILIGFITLDNILGSLFGHMRDEFNKTQDDWVKSPDGAYLMKGNLPIYALEKALNIDIEAESIDTISGLVLSKLERLPILYERISFEQFDIEVQKMKGPKIILVKVFLHQETGLSQNNI